MILLIIIKFLGLIGLVFLIGFGVLRLIRFQYNSNYFYAQLFATFLTGLIFGVFCLSLFKTTGQTIQIVFLPIICFLFYEYRYHLSSTKIKDILHIQPSFLNIFFNIIIGSILILGWNYAFTLNEVTVSDHVFYSRISSYIYLSGQENEYHIANALGEEFWGTSPYHYFELWLNAGITALFGGLSIINFLLYASSLLVFTVYLGFLAIWERFGKLDWVGLICCNLGLYLGGFIFGYIFNIDFLIGYEFVSYPFMLYNTVKFSVFYIFATASILCFLYNYKMSGFLLLLILPVVSFAALPTIFGTIGLFILINCIRPYFISRNESLRLFLYTTLVFLSIIVFYALTKGTLLARDATQVNDLLGLFGDLMNTTYLRTRINIILGSLIRLGILFFPFIILLGLFIKKYQEGFNLKWIIFIFLSMNLIGLITWALLYQAVNSAQLFYLVLKGTNVLIFLLLVYFFTQFKQPVYRFIFILIFMANTFMNIYYKIKHQSSPFHPNEFQEEIAKEVDSLNPIGIFIQHPSEFNGIFQKYTSFKAYDRFLVLVNNQSIAVSLSDAEISVSQEDMLIAQQEKKALNLSFFLAFIKLQKQRKQFVSIDQSQVDFIQKHKVQYAFVSAKADLSPLIKKMIKKEIKNKNSGQRFLILDYKKNITNE